MNRKFISAIALSLLMAAGCSSTPAEKPAEPSDDKTTTTQPAKDDKTNSDQTATDNQTPAVSADFEAVRKAAVDAGFTVQEEDIDKDDYDLDLMNDTGKVELSVEIKADSSSARAEYKNEIDDELNDGYQQVNTYTSDGKELSLLINDINNMYTIVAVDDATSQVITIDDILEGNRDACLNIMKSLGYPVE